MTTSLNLSKKLAALNLGVESDFCWAKLFRHQFYKEDIIDEEYRILYKLRHDGYAGINSFYRAYTLHELLPVLKALGKKKGWVSGCNICTDLSVTGMHDPSNFSYECKNPRDHLTKGHLHEYQRNFLRIAELYAQSESLEGVEKYIEELIK
jgi:hypothetical protein